MSFNHIAVILTACCVSQSLPATARAQLDAAESGYAKSDFDTAELAADPTAAEVEFAKGRDLLRNGDDAGACSAFERSRRLNTTVAVLINLGLCHYRTGHMTTAYRCYHRAEVLAALSGDPRLAIAREEAAKLSALRAALTLNMTEPVGSGVEVHIDGTLQPFETWSQPMFVDAGDHTLTVHAAGRSTWHATVQMQDGKPQVLTVPELTPQSAPHPLIQVSEVPVKRAHDEVRSNAGASTSKVVALAVGSAGVVSLGVGLVFGVLAQSEFSDAKPYCTGDMCETPGLEHRSAAIDHATRATVLSIAGAAALAAGIIVWLTAPTSDETRPVAVHNDFTGTRVVARF